MATGTVTQELMDYAYELGASLHHATICHKCGDTDYECPEGRDLRVGAMTKADELRRDESEDIRRVVSVLETKPLLGRGFVIACAWDVVSA